MSPELLGWLASIFYVSRLLPQPFRLIRTRLPEGVSSVAAMNAVITEVAWLAYGLHADLTPVWVVAVFALPPTIWTVALLRRETGRRHLLRSGVWLVLVVAAGLLGSLGAVLAISVVVNIGPQVWLAVRRTDLRGLSTYTWLFAIADGLLWGGYGAAVGDGALVAYAVVLVIGAVVVLARMARTGSIGATGAAGPHREALDAT